MNNNRKTLASVLAALAIIASLVFTLAGGAGGARAAAVTSRLSSPRNAVSGSAQVARALRSGQLKFNGGQPPTRMQTALTCSPVPCVLPNAQASEGGQPVNETAIAVNPKNAKQMVSGANDYNCTSSYAAFYASSDGGSTWNMNCMGTLAGEQGCGDPSIGYDLNNTVYVTSLENCTTTTSSIIFEKSINNGTTWSAPAVAVSPTFFDGEVDKSWLQIDDNASSPHANTLYLSVTQFNSNDTSEQISVSHSSNGGASWQTSLVESATSYPVVDQFSDLAIGKDGTVYVSWMRCTAGGSTGDCGGTLATFYFSKSTDGGNTWSSPVAIAQANLAPDDCPRTFGCFYGGIPNTIERVSNIPVMDIDNSSGTHHGNLYVVFYNWTGTFMKVEVATSTNGGSSWGTPVGVAPVSATHDQFFPWLTVSSGGIVGVTWLDRRDDPQNISYKMYFTYSTTGGTSFATNKALATTLSNPFNDGFGGEFMGDYTGNSWTSAKPPTLFASWEDMRNTVTSQDEVGGYIK